MNKYTVDIVKENPITGIANVCALRRHGGMWIDLPVGVKNGDHIWALCDHRGVEIVYVCNQNLKFLAPPVSDMQIRSFVRQFPDITDGSLERVRYKFVLMQALVAHKIWPSLSATNNLRMYINACRNGVTR